MELDSAFAAPWKLSGLEDEFIQVLALWLRQEVTGNVSVMLDAREKGECSMHNSRGGVRP